MPCAPGRGERIRQAIALEAVLLHLHVPDNDHYDIVHLRAQRLEDRPTEYVQTGWTQGRGNQVPPHRAQITNKRFLVFINDLNSSGKISNLYTVENNKYTNVN